MSEEAEIQPTTTISNPYNDLDDRDKIYVDMAARNIPYDDIAVKAHRDYTTIKDWFCKSGSLYQAYTFRKAQLRKEFNQKFKAIDQQIQEGAVDAIVTIREVAKRKSMPGVVAAKDILDRAGFKPKDRLEIDSKIPFKVHVTIEKKYDKDEQPKP